MINEQLITDEGSCQLIIGEFITSNNKKMALKKITKHRNNNKKMNVKNKK
ncbi:hypothetical protein BHWA1_01060 [Brachyspira hyodysenteriae WA1]|uniref:Uncharacterized protein n=1 Tax=Brachyspira hyodysenteriae (strain ATCC 49526 / WA1) TaxID=565034 RepID=A0A3B6VBW9_BRAHW|nr:hypothetical protein BHWA1_01060 [Brachyspira hyodysenteriae WA1]